MADPLYFLRKYNVKNKTIFERNNRIIFGAYSWPKTAKTNYVVWKSGTDGTPKSYYTLESLLFLLKNVQLRHPVYVRQAVARNILFVKRPDRKNLLKYLNGETSTSASIDKGVPIELPNIAKSNSEDQSKMKKPKLEDSGIKQAEDQHATQRNAPKETSVITEHIRSITDVMSAEMIASIKAKHSAKKESSIRVPENVEDNYADLRHIFDYALNATQDIINREKKCQARSTMLQITGKPSDCRLDCSTSNRDESPSSLFGF